MASIQEPRPLSEKTKSLAHDGSAKNAQPRIIAMADSDRPAIDRGNLL